jgi:hypothetical protein
VHDAFLHQAAIEHLLADVAGRAIRVVSVEALGSEWAPVTRLTLDSDLAGVGRSVVVKARRCGEQGWGFDVANLRNERAALATLAALGVEVAPRPVAGDDELGILVMSDLGRGPTVEELLFGADPAAATKGLEALGRAVGRLHAGTMGPGACAGYYSRRAALGPVDAAGERRSMFGGPANKWAVLCEQAASSGFPRGEPAAAEVAALYARLDEPGRFLALTQLDLTPSNAVLAGEEARLLDFESAGFRHVALDVACLRFPFPHYGRWAVLPDAVRRATEGAYRAEVAAGWPGAADEGEYAQIVAAGCGVWAINRSSRLPRIKREDDESWRRRVQIVQTIEVFVRAAREAGAFPALAAWFSDLVAAMRERWPEANDPPPQFSAYERTMGLS